jgi:hypothetical protein
MSPLALSFSFVCILRVLRGDISPDNRTLFRDINAYSLCMCFCAPGIPLHNLTSVHQVHEYVVLNVHAVRTIPCLSIMDLRSYDSSMMSRHMYDNTGAEYNVSKILTPQSTFDENAYKQYSPLFLSYAAMSLSLLSRAHRI